MEKLIEHPSTPSLAEEQAVMGLGLAFTANDARNRADEIKAARERVLRENMSSDDQLMQAFRSQDNAIIEATVYSKRHMEYVNAAGALIGKYTLGSEFLSIQNGKAPVLASNGTFRLGSAG